MSPHLPKRLLATLLAIAPVADVARADVDCWPAIEAVTSTLPELVGKGARFTWRGLPVEFGCRGREIGTITLRWSAGATGTHNDARSAIAALGSHLTGDTATAVRGALDRCVTAAGRASGPQRSTSSRSAVTCSVGQDGATFTVQRRDEDG